MTLKTLVVLVGLGFAQQVARAQEIEIIDFGEGFGPPALAAEIGAPPCNLSICSVGDFDVLADYNLATGAVTNITAHGDACGGNGQLHGVETSVQSIFGGSYLVISGSETWPGCPWMAD